MFYSELPPLCQKCRYLNVTAIYMNGEADYCCRDLECALRPRFKKSVIIAKERKENEY